MKALIESLPDFARFDADGEPMQRALCDLADLTQDCSVLLRPLAEAKRLCLDLDLQPAPCYADATRFTQVITNLCTNAIHFSPDTGIAPEQLPHLFERFHRADTSRTRATGGTGLGLAICKAIVEAHDGTIAVESEVAKGSTFTVLLPPKPR